jgi:translation initiation factor 2 beta subunit (eIF-2beta)/eIF-5
MASKKINMNGSEDESYRYKMPGFDVSMGGAGNGRFTILNNIDNISRAVNHPVPVICRFITSITGSSYIEARKQITGTYTASELNRLIIEYIKSVVLCPKCGIPETIPSVVGSKKNANIKLSCSACKTESQLKPINKYADKAIDILIKYINSNGIEKWTVSKGSIVTNTCSDGGDNIQQSSDLMEEKENDPFNIDEI